MALLFADSFEHYGTSTAARANMLAGLYSTTAATAVIVNNPAIARTGNRYYSDYQAGGTSIRYPTNSNEVGAAVGIFLPQMPSSSNGRCGFSIRDELQNTIINVAIQPNGSVTIERTDSAASVIGQTDSGLITTGAWHHFEVRVLQDNVVGEVELRINGVLELIVNNVDLGTVLPRFWRTWGGSALGSVDRYLDDLILWDTTGGVNNTFFGPARCIPNTLASDVAGGQWSVVGAASGAAAMTEGAPDADTSYVTAAALSNTSDYNLSGLPPEAEAIAGVCVIGMAKLAAGGLGNAQVSLVSDGEVAAGEDNVLTSAYTYRVDIFEKDPATDQLWTKSALEAATLRLEKTA
jgi:hypothetical protein